jgi:hypothetical protein
MLRQGARAPDLLQDYAYGGALPWRHVSRREARSVRVREEHEGGQHADKHSRATPGLDARETTKAGLDREGVTGLADRQ